MADYRKDFFSRQKNNYSYLATFLGPALAASIAFPASKYMAWRSADSKWENEHKEELQKGLVRSEHFSNILGNRGLLDSTARKLAKPSTHDEGETLVLKHSIPFKIPFIQWDTDAAQTDIWPQRMQKNLEDVQKWNEQHKRNEQAVASAYRMMRKKSGDLAQVGDYIQSNIDKYKLGPFGGDPSAMYKVNPVDPSYFRELAESEKIYPLAEPNLLAEMAKPPLTSPMLQQGGEVPRYGNGGTVPAYPDGGLQYFLDNPGGNVLGRRIRKGELAGFGSLLGIPGSEDAYTAETGQDAKNFLFDTLGDKLSPEQLTAMSTIMKRLLRHVNANNQLSQGVRGLGQKFADFIDRRAVKGTVMGDTAHSIGEFGKNWFDNVAPDDNADPNNPDYDSDKAFTETYKPKNADDVGVLDTIINSAKNAYYGNNSLKDKPLNLDFTGGKTTLNPVMQPRDWKRLTEADFDTLRREVWGDTKPSPAALQSWLENIRALSQTPVGQSPELQAQMMGADPTNPQFMDWVQRQGPWDTGYNAQYSERNASENRAGNPYLMPEMNQEDITPPMHSYPKYSRARAARTPVNSQGDIDERRGLLEPYTPPVKGGPTRLRGDEPAEFGDRPDFYAGKQTQRGGVSDYNIVNVPVNVPAPGEYLMDVPKAYSWMMHQHNPDGSTKMFDGNPIPKLDINETAQGVPADIIAQHGNEPVFTYEWLPEGQWTNPGRAEWDYTKPIYRNPQANAMRALNERGGDINYAIDPYTSISKTGVNPIIERDALTRKLPPVQVQPPYKQYSREELTKGQEVQQRFLDRTPVNNRNNTPIQGGSVAGNQRGEMFFVNPTYTVPGRHGQPPTIAPTPARRYFNISQPIDESQPLDPDRWRDLARSVVENNSKSAVRPFLRPIGVDVKAEQEKRISGARIAKLYDESPAGERILRTMSTRMNPSEVRGPVMDAGTGQQVMSPLEHWLAGKPRIPRNPDMRTPEAFLASGMIQEENPLIPEPERGTHANTIPGAARRYMNNPNALIDPFPAVASNRGVSSTPNQVARVPLMPPPPVRRGPHGEMIPDTPFSSRAGSPQYRQGEQALQAHIAQAQARNPINYATRDIPSLPSSVLGAPPEFNDRFNFGVFPPQNYGITPTMPEVPVVPTVSPWGPQHPRHPNNQTGLTLAPAAPAPQAAPTLGALPAPPATGGAPAAGNAQPTGLWPQPYGNPSTTNTTAGRTNQYGNWQEFFRGGEVQRFDVGGIVPRFQAQDEYDYDSYDQQVAAQLLGGSVPRYDAGGVVPGGGYPLAMQQQLAMSEAKQLKQIAEAQGMGEQVDPGYYQRQLMETYMQQHANPQAQQGQTTPNGVFDPTGQMLMQQQQAAAADQQQGGPMGMVNPQIKARVPYYQAQYQKLAQRAASPKGAMKNIVPMKARV